MPLDQTRSRRSSTSARPCVSQRGTRCETHGRAEVEERLERVRSEGMSGALLDPGDVRVHGQHRLVERLVADRGRGVGANAGEGGQILRPALFSDHARGTVQVESAAVVAEPLPGADHIGGSCSRKRGGRGPALEPGVPTRDHALDLCLLQHHLADEDRVWVLRVAPGQFPPVCVEPSQ